MRLTSGERKYAACLFTALFVAFSMFLSRPREARADLYNPSYPCDIDGIWAVGTPNPPQSYICWIGYDCEYVAGGFGCKTKVIRSAWRWVPAQNDWVQWGNPWVVDTSVWCAQKAQDRWEVMYQHLMPGHYFILQQELKDQLPLATGGKVLYTAQNLIWVP